MQDPSKTRVQILFGCANMYCGKPWNVKNFSKHPVTVCNMFVSDYTEHLLFMMLWEHLHCSCPSSTSASNLPPQKTHSTSLKKTAGYCPRPREFLSWFLWQILGKATFLQVVVRSCELRVGIGIEMLKLIAWYGKSMFSKSWVILVQGAHFVWGQLTCREWTTSS